MKNMLTLEAFLDWLEKKPPKRRYTYDDMYCCACGQYARHIGLREYHGNWGPGDWYTLRSHGSFWYKADKLAGQTGKTFGALAERVREYIHLHAG